MKSAIRKPERISADMLGEAASIGVARAIEARKVAGVELSDAEVRDVSGGLTTPIVRGIPPAVTRGVIAPVNTVAE